MKSPRPAQRPRWRPHPRQRLPGRAPISSTPAQVRERKLGDLFEYEIEHPVTIRRNQAALVPIVLREFKGRPVLLYNKQTRAENPMRCVEFENSTGLTLEGGPVTVLEGGSYVGEAMLETLKPDETRLIPFAVELGVKVLDNVDSRDEHVSRVIIDRGTLEARYGQVSATTYQFDNKGDAPAVVYLDHPREGDDWTLVEPATAHEVTDSYWRFRFDLDPGGVTTFVVRKERLLSQRCTAGRRDRPPARGLDQPAVPRPADRDRSSARPSSSAGRSATPSRRSRGWRRSGRRSTRRRSGSARTSSRWATGRPRRSCASGSSGRSNGQEDRLEAIAAEVASLTHERDRLRQEMADRHLEAELRGRPGLAGGPACTQGTEAPGATEAP